MAKILDKVVVPLGLKKKSKRVDKKGNKKTTITIYEKGNK